MRSIMRQWVRIRDHSLRRRQHPWAGQTERESSGPSEEGAELCREGVRASRGPFMPSSMDPHRPARKLPGARGRVTCGEWRGESPAPTQGPGERLSPEPQWVLKFKDTGWSRQKVLASVMGQNAALGPHKSLKTGLKASDSFQIA